MSDFLSSLNPVQLEAVQSYQGSSLIIAGAGSGKTRVLTCRIANMLAHGVPPSAVLALTFTNKAAKEMKERIANVVGERARYLWMGTFHSIFAKILRFEAEKIGFTSSYTIYDATDSRSLLRAIIKEMKLDENTYKVNDVHARISMAKNNLITPGAYAASGSISSSDVQARKPHMAMIYAAYARRCKSAGAMDFDDLLLFTNVLFRDYPDVLQKYRDKFKYVLVDEYQDTNYAQYLIIKKLTEEHRNLCVVGDDAQSIYSFRGAKIENILNFQKDFPECKVFKLEQNYRSTQNIVNAANSVIEKNSGQLKKKCFSEGVKGEKVGVLSAFTDQEEGLRVVADIADRVYGAQAQYSNFAILYRTNSQSRIFEDSLRRKNIPYRIYGGQSFYQRKETKDLLAYLRLIVNHSDDEAFKRIVNYPRRGIGDTTIARLEEIASQSNMSLWDAILSLTPEQADIRGSAYKKISQFLLMIDAMSNSAAEQEAYDLAYAVAQQSGVLAELRADKTIEGITRLENVEELLNGIKEFCENYKEENGTSPLVAQYLENVSLLTDADKDKPEEVNTVSLMTIHAAKGLEYAYVYVVGMEENLFPGKLSMMSQRDLEEERRLFYVALTRAKVKATISFAQTRYRWGKPESNPPSRFLREINPAYISFTAMEVDADMLSQDPDDYEKGYATSSPPRFAPKAPVQRQAYSPRTSRTPHAPSQSPPSSPASGAALEHAGSLAVGAVVEHKNFGRGVVLSIENLGGDVKVTVTFKLVGKKALLMKYAKLKIVNG
ncbi:MAG: UvrD-helicase domain-containing protein [Prevotellaceae bacterium]|jgi:DNA helicase-2/ATP-dependent DNA helicase PcrA|nr:UvrD-helicase domain-containing protein [Prevotellaceae bacterium]